MGITLAVYGQYRGRTGAGQGGRKTVYDEKHTNSNTKDGEWHTVLSVKNVAIMDKDERPLIFGMICGRRLTIM